MEESPSQQLHIQHIQQHPVFSVPMMKFSFLFNRKHINNNLETTTGSWVYIPWGAEHLEQLRMK